MTELPAPIRPAAPADLRRQIRDGSFTSPTTGSAPGYVHCNLVMLPRGYAGEFAAFCGANAAACPVVAMSQAGATSLPGLGDDVDLTTDAGSYRVFEHGRAVTELSTLERVWQGDFVTFALGSADSFDGLFARRAIATPYLARGDVRAHYITGRDAAPAGNFRGPLAVSMRPMPADEVEAVAAATAAHPKLHGAPAAIGDPAQLGIASLELSVARHGTTRLVDGEAPVFWPSGLTAHLALAAARVPLCVTNTPGHLLVTDIDVASLCEEEEKDEEAPDTAHRNIVRDAFDAAAMVELDPEDADLREPLLLDRIVPEPAGVEDLGLRRG